MNFKINAYILLVTLLFLSSCISTHELMESHATDIVRFSVSGLNGNYANLEDTAWGTLWSSLYRCKSFREDKTLIPENAYVNLHFEKDNMIVASLIVNDTILNRIELKGKMKGDYFSIRRKLFLVPIPVLFWIHKETKVVIGEAQNGDLIVKNADFNAGWILIFAAGGLNGYYENTYAKLD